MQKQYEQNNKMNEFDNIKIDHIPILDWTLIRNTSEKESLIETYQIKNDFEIIAIDILGDIIVKKGSKLYSLNHEEPQDEALLIVSDISKLVIILVKILSLPEYFIHTPLSKLKEIKKELIGIKKEIDKGLRSIFEDEIEDLKELISDWKFYQTDEGKRYLITESFKDDFYTKIQRPKKYRRIEVEREFKSRIIKIIGVCEKEGESKEYLEKILKEVDCKLSIEFGKIYTFEEYQKALEK